MALIISLHIRSILSGSSMASAPTTTSPSRSLSTSSRRRHATTDDPTPTTGSHPSLGRQPSITLPRLSHQEQEAQEQEAHPHLTPLFLRHSLPWPLTTHNNITTIESTVMLRRARANKQAPLTQESGQAQRLVLRPLLPLRCEEDYNDH
ncbi:hypothetical protein BKA57DRAFT_226009 [Linnemannia elongata]|nr:hypothetical protein BKA57DRAFT_226009 [Linnemannia elongata]